MWCILELHKALWKVILEAPPESRMRNEDFKTKRSCLKRNVEDTVQNTAFHLQLLLDNSA